MTLEMFTDGFLTVCMIILAITILIFMIRAVIGPRVGDRVVCINMIGTLVMVIIGILAVKWKQGYMADICLIYAMISFLAVVVLCKVYIGVYLQHKNDRKESEDDAE